MGKGDRKTRRGKLFAGTFGVRRTKKKRNRKLFHAKKSGSANTLKNGTHKAKVTTGQVETVKEKPVAKEIEAVTTEESVPEETVAAKDETENKQQPQKAEKTDKKEAVTKKTEKTVKKEKPKTTQKKKSPKDK